MATTVSLPASTPPPITAPPSCYQKFQSKLASRIVTAKRCVKECCSADGRTYALFIMGRFLQAAAVTGMLASLACAFFFGPVTILGTLPSTGVFALGHFLVKKNIPKSHSILFSHPILNWLVPKTFIPGQPVGLTNSSSNCYINAALQCVIHTPALRERACRTPQLAQFINQYQQTQNTARSKCELNGENLNVFLVGAMRLQETGQISAENRHADASVFFEWLFGQHPLHQFLSVLTRPDGSVSYPPPGEDLIELQLTPNTPVNAQTLFNQFLDYNTGGTRHQLKFTARPETIAVKLNRGYGVMTNPADPTSFQRVHIQDPVEGVNALTLPQGALLFADTQARYLCHAFIMHFGGLDGGHYVAYVKKDGKWWCCNDTNVSEVSEQAAMEQMKKSYLVFLNRG